MALAWEGQNIEEKKQWLLLLEEKAETVLKKLRKET